MKSYKLLILLVATLAGAFLRFYQLGNNPPSLYWDEVAIGLDAYSVANTGRDINNYHWLQPMFGSYGDFKAPVYIWLASLAVKIFGFSDWSVRLPSAVFGTLLIPLMYWFTRELLSQEKRRFIKRWLPLTVACLVAFSPWTLHFSRVGFESFLSVFWVILSLIFVSWGLRRSGWWLIPASLFAVLGLYTYFSVRIILPPIIGLWGLLSYRKLWQRKWGILAGVAIFAVSLYPLLTSRFYEISQNYRLGTKNLVRNYHLVEESSRFLERHQSSVLSKLAYHRYWFIGRDFLDHYVKHFSPRFLFFQGEINLRHNTGFGGLFLAGLSPIFLLGIYWFLKNIAQPLAQKVTAIWIFAPVASSLTYEVPNSSRSMYVLVPVIIVLGLGIITLIDKTKKYWRIILVSLVLVVGINFGLYWHDYLVHYPARSSQDWIYAYKLAAEYIKDHPEYIYEDISATYWMPQLYVAYEMPEYLKSLRDIKRSQLKDTPNAFGFPEIHSWLPQPSAGDQLVVRFADPQAKMDFSQFIILDKLYFLDGEPALFLIKDKSEES